MTEAKVDALNLEERRKTLGYELEGCINVEYIFSKTSDTNDQDKKTTPVIFLKERLKNKHKFLEITTRSIQSAVNGNMGEREARMFLNIDHKDDKYQLYNELPDAIYIGNTKAVSV